MIEHKEILAAALVGFNVTLKGIQEKIGEIEKELRGTKTEATTAPVKKTRRMSAAGRKRIQLAQKKRWAAHKKAKVAA